MLDCALFGILLQFCGTFELMKLPNIRSIFLRKSAGRQTRLNKNFG